MGWSNSIERCRSKPQMRPDGQIDVVAEGPSEDGISVVFMRRSEPESQDVYTQCGTLLILFEAILFVFDSTARLFLPLPPRLNFVARALVWTTSCLCLRSLKAVPSFGATHHLSRLHRRRILVQPIIAPWIQRSSTSIPRPYTSHT